MNKTIENAAPGLKGGIMADIEAQDTWKAVRSITEDTCTDFAIKVMDIMVPAGLIKSEYGDREWGLQDALTERFSIVLPTGDAGVVFRDVMDILFEQGFSIPENTRKKIKAELRKLIRERLD